MNKFENMSFEKTNNIIKFFNNEDSLQLKLISILDTQSLNDLNEMLGIALELNFCYGDLLFPFYYYGIDEGCDKRVIRYAVNNTLMFKDEKECKKFVDKYKDENQHILLDNIKRLSDYIKQERILLPILETQIDMNLHLLYDMAGFSSKYTISDLHLKCFEENHNTLYYENGWSSEWKEPSRYYGNNTYFSYIVEYMCKYLISKNYKDDYEFAKRDAYKSLCNNLYSNNMFNDKSIIELIENLQFLSKYDLYHDGDFISLIMPDAITEINTMKLLNIKDEYELYKFRFYMFKYLDIFCWIDIEWGLSEQCEGKYYSKYNLRMKKY